MPEQVDQGFQGHGVVKQITMQAKIIRADGSVEDLGMIASYKMPAWKRALHWLLTKGK